MVFDGDCGFCRSWIARWQRLTGDSVAFEPFQQAAARFPTVPRERFRRAVQLIEPQGEVFEGAEAVFRALAAAPNPGHRRWLDLYQRLPGARPVLEWGYRWVATHRPALTRLDRLVFGVPPPADGVPDSAAGRRARRSHQRRRVLAFGVLGLGAAFLVGGLFARRARRHGRPEDPLSPGSSAPG